MPLAKARIQAGNFTLLLPINPYTAAWDYKENTMSYDTIGGRVVQLLSVQIGGLAVTSVAGSRRELQRIAEGVRKIMEFHIETSRPANFKVPSREWNFSVYLQAMPQIGWDVASTSYPYQMQMAVEEDISGIQTRKVTINALTRLAENIGYKKGFHGGEAAAFQKLVSTVLANSEDPFNGSGTSDTSGAATGSQWQGKGGLWSERIASAPWSGSTIKDQIENMWSSVFGSRDGAIAACIAGRESGYRPSANYSYTEKGRKYYVYGLFQISSIHSAAAWYPKSGISGTNGGLLFDPEYNTRCAMQMFQSQGWEPWVSTSGACGV